MKTIVRFWGLMAAALWLAVSSATARAETAGPRLYYHVFVRSFADSDGDRIGDLQGLRARLDYLAGLHVTHILLTPIQTSPFYHNYFATDFDAVDPSYGGEASWRALVRAAHARKMRIILDEEFQYVAEGHPWWRDGEGRPGGPFGGFLLWTDPANQRSPEPFLNAPRWRTHDGRMVGIAMVNLNRPDVRAWFQRMLLRRVADGADGFRLDHMMDDLDDKGLERGLLRGFWRPLIMALRRRRPDLEFIAEPSDWGDGRRHLAEGGATAVFDFPLRQVLVRLDPEALRRAVRPTPGPPGSRRLTFLENHDVDRYASLVGSDPRKLQIGALLTLTLGSDPVIYYGQELGMRGVEQRGAGSDGAQIPLREAFRWRADLDAPGSAVWYQGDAPWWTARANRSGDGVSVEEEKRDPGSLLLFYRRLLRLRAKRVELWRGRLETGCDAPPAVFCFTRRSGRHWTLVVTNLSDAEATLRTAGHDLKGASDLLGRGRIAARQLVIPPWGFRVLGDVGGR